MWDSAKKPIKIRSVLQSNGMRHFVVNEETDEVYSNIMNQQQQKRKNITKKVNRAASDKNDDLDRTRQQSQMVTDKEKVSNNDDLAKKIERSSKANSSPLTRSHSFGEQYDAKSLAFVETDNRENFFGVAGNRICNSKKHKGLHHHNRYFQQIHPTHLKEASLIQLHKDSSLTSRCPHIKVDMLDLIPVKSPVIKKLINGRTSTSTSNGTYPSSGTNNQPGTSPSSTTLCSRIMTWIDLEVKRNSIKGRSSGGVPFSSADLDIVNDLNEFERDSTPSSSSVNSGSTTPSGEGSSSSNSSSSGTSNDSNTLVSLPKLVPCWRKENREPNVAAGVISKVKKSVRIAEDLPRWGKMKRRLRKTDRSFSLNELYNDDELSISAFVTDTKVNRRKQFSPVIGLGDDDGCTQEKAGSPPRSRHDAAKTEGESSFYVCDENLPTTGKVQVHIFLPQTDNSTDCGKEDGAGTCDNESNLSGRSEDSTF